MEFFTSHDWFNRPGPSYAFKIDHILFVVISMLIGIGLCFLLRNKDKALIKKVIVGFRIFAVVTVTIYYGASYILCIANPSKYPFNIESMLPFHSCLMFIYVFPFAVFSKNRIVKLCASNFIVVVNMIIGFITLFVGCPPVGYSAFSFPGFQSLVLHVVIVIVPLIMVATNYYDIKLHDLKYGLALFGALGITMWIFDAISGCDYFYFYDGHTFPVFKFISENVPHLVWTLIVVSCYVITGCAIHFLIIGIKHLLNKSKENHDEQQSNESPSLS